MHDPFAPFRTRVLGADARVPGPLGPRPLVYADWIAGGRLYAPIEDRLQSEFGPFVANTHSESSWCGRYMTEAYHQSRAYMKAAIGAWESDVLLPAGTGMTGALSKLQRMLGLRLPEQFASLVTIPPAERPLVIISHMEHHSNHTSWLETIADVHVLEPGPDLLIRPEALEEVLARNRDRPLKIGSFTAASNVTGVRTPYRDLARIMHRHGGWCFVDFAASAPYDTIRMHTEDPAESLDAVFFSVHKFLGGPGSTGVVCFNRALYKNRVPDQPGGGTVRWTNPWHEHSYIDDIEVREDGGTPGFLQTIRAALAFSLKEELGVEAMHVQEGQLLARALGGLDVIPGVRVLAREQEDRIGAVSFYLPGIHYNLVVRLLSDRWGIQMRGGCSCAGTYGHYLLHVDPGTSRRISGKISTGDLSEKPGWVRWSIHPITAAAEIDCILEALAEIARHGKEWEADYSFNVHTGEWEHRHWKAPTMRFF